MQLLVPTLILHYFSGMRGQCMTFEGFLGTELYEKDTVENAFKEYTGSLTLLHSKRPKLYTVSECHRVN